MRLRAERQSRPSTSLCIRRGGFRFRFLSHLVKTDCSVVIGNGQSFVIRSEVDVEAWGTLPKLEPMKRHFFFGLPEPKEASSATAA